jgi:hypothetical protein
MNYEIIVGNIGSVYSGPSKREANRAFREYVDQSKSGYGRASGEEVTMFCDGETVKEYFPKVRWFPVREIERLLKDLKGDILDDYRIDGQEDETPTMQVTISTKDGSSWSFQTGDTSYTGGCYGDPHWAVIYLTRRSNCKELARDAVNELKDLVACS